MLSIKLRELREEKNLTQQALASALSLERYVVSNWEQGRTEPNVGQLIALSNYFEVTVDYLLGRENDIGLVEVKTDLTTDEQELINLYRKLSFGDKNQLLGFAKGLIYWGALCQTT